MFRQCLCLFVCLFFTMAKTQPGVATDACPPTDFGSASDVAWALRNYLYMVYDTIQPDGTNVTTAWITFDIQGGFSNQSVHCEAAGPQLVANYTGPNQGSKWRLCVPNNKSSETGYTTMFKYNQDEYWDVIELKETSMCGNDPKRLYVSPWYKRLTHVTFC